MFNIFGDYHGRVISIVTALMTNCTIGHYRQVLQRIKSGVRRVTRHDWEPTAVVMDFEQALLSAVETEFPDTVAEGCYFNFNQSLWRHIKELRLAREYRRDERLKQLLRKVMSIGFLPTALVQNNFQLLRHERQTQRLIRRYAVLNDFFNYVYNT